MTENVSYDVSDAEIDNCSKINSRATFKESSLWREYQDSILNDSNLCILALTLGNMCIYQDHIEPLRVYSEVL